MELIEPARADCSRLAKNWTTRSVAGQLYRSIGSIAANLAEGYSRSSGKDRVRLLEYALGSARESLVWYNLGRGYLPNGIDAQEQRLIRICQLLLATIPRDRSRMIRKEMEPHDPRSPMENQNVPD
jgi:four helix bundle protein